LKILAFETSCDETSVALVHDGLVVSNVVASQIDTHKIYGGVVPEIAARQHLQNIKPVIDSVFQETGLGPDDIDGVAATRGPGLPPALMIGFRAAQGFAFALDLPFVGLHHHEAHLYSPWTSGNPPRAEFDQIRPSVSLIVSGGHTLLVRVDKPLEHRILGGTIDDAAGECFDKVAKLIGLPYPGGPEVDRLAVDGNPTAYRFPRPMLKEANDDFSFSGLKTSVRYFLEKNSELLESASAIRDLCASVQAAIVEVLVKKTMRAVDRLGFDTVTAAGGVTCNRGLRGALQKACDEQGVQLKLSQPELCTDNAGMVGLLGSLYFESSDSSRVNDDDIRPGWTLEAVSSGS
jgi:N6-L-threonylcarbamoyladenine synthase